MSGTRTSEAAVRAAFSQQAAWCRQLGSPFTAMLCEALERTLDEGTATGRRVLGWAGDPVPDALALRLSGGLHALVRAGRLPGLASLYPPNPAPEAATLEEAVTVAVADADADLLPWLDSAPQTNEVARSGVLYPGLLAVAAEAGLPIRLHELGASAGLNLRLDTYGYTLGQRAFGPADAAIRFAPKWEGPPPPEAQVRVVERRGVDLNPLDVTDPATRARLIAYVWPDQPERLARIVAALEAAAADPAPLDRSDAADWVERVIATAPGACTVVQHSIAFTYFPAEARARIAAHMERVGAEATADAPLAWLRYEFEDTTQPPALRLSLWPGAKDRLLAHAHPHGAEVRWVG